MNASNNNNQSNAQVEKINTYICLLVLVTIIWAIVSFWYISDKRASDPNYIDSSTNTNSIVIAPISPALDKSIHKYDVVIIKFFFIKGVVLDKSKDSYVILYEDQNHILQKITLSEDLLFKPSTDLLFPSIK